ncbi:MAG: hypothetical protein O3C29_00005, partial [Proteobacteria bacterium]|nr:hypothetical protein [Pseudomonadota bacterium]
MAITADTRKSIIEMVVGAYNAAPGTTLLTSLVAKSEAGKSLAEIATILTTSDTFNATYPSFQTAAEFGEEFLANLLPGVSAAALAEGVTIVEGLLAAGGTRADVVRISVEFLAKLDEADTAIGTYAANFNNKVEVATYYTLTLEQADVSTTAIASVTSDDATVTAANATASTTSASVAGSTYTLTTGLDNKTLGAGDDQAFATDSTTAADDTFNVSDLVAGGAGEDTFFLTVDSLAAATTYAPSRITGFEKLSV